MSHNQIVGPIHKFSSGWLGTYKWCMVAIHKSERGFSIFKVLYKRAVVEQLPIPYMATTILISADSNYE